MEEKNPFSLFDFLGYFFPGAFALLIIWSSYIVWPKEDILPISYICDSISYYSNGMYFPEKGCHLGTNRSDNET